MSSSRDPFELERLADELEEREDSLDTPAHDLPLYPPLAHSNPFFIASHFNVEDFLLSRVHTSLPDLRAELRDYLGVLKEELVQLINDDYEAFISLSTDLRGEGTRLERLKWPLGDLKSQIIVRFAIIFAMYHLAEITCRNRNNVSLLCKTLFRVSLKKGPTFAMRRFAQCIHS